MISFMLRFDVKRIVMKVKSFMGVLFEIWMWF